VPVPQQPQTNVTSQLQPAHYLPHSSAPNFSQISPDEPTPTHFSPPGCSQTPPNEPDVNNKGKKVVIAQAKKSTPNEDVPLIARDKEAVLSVSRNFNPNCFVYVAGKKTDGEIVILSPSFYKEEGLMKRNKDVYLKGIFKNYSTNKHDKLLKITDLKTGDDKTQVLFTFSVSQQSDSIFGERFNGFIFIFGTQGSTDLYQTSMFRVADTKGTKKDRFTTEISSQLFKYKAHNRSMDKVYINPDEGPVNDPPPAAITVKCTGSPLEKTSRNVVMFGDKESDAVMVAVVKQKDEETQEEETDRTHHKLVVTVPEPDYFDGPKKQVIVNVYNSRYNVVGNVLYYTYVKGQTPVVGSTEVAVSQELKQQTQTDQQNRQTQTGQQNPPATSQQQFTSPPEASSNAFSSVADMSHYCQYSFLANILACVSENICEMVSTFLSCTHRYILARLCVRVYSISM
jgi:hypothetical protein